MKVITAMLADAARVESGKLYIHGGGWDNISTGSFPTLHPTLALVLTLQVEYDEALQEIPISISLINEDGEELGPVLEGSVTTGHPPGSKRGSPTLVHQAITFNALRFEAAGGYTFVVKSKDTELQRVSFRLLKKR
jgi:hypothetical protein